MSLREGPKEAPVEAPGTEGTSSSTASRWGAPLPEAPAEAQGTAGTSVATATATALSTINATTGSAAATVEYAAQSVFKSGPGHEAVLRALAPARPEFSFLLHQESPAFRTYQERLNTLRRDVVQAAFNNAAKQHAPATMAAPPAKPTSESKLPVQADMPVVEAPHGGRFTMGPGGVGRVFIPPKGAAPKPEADKSKRRTREEEDEDERRAARLRAEETSSREEEPPREKPKRRRGFREEEDE